MVNTKQFFKYVLPVYIISTLLFSVEWLSDSVPDGPNLHGLIYPQSSDAIGSSFAYEFYLKGILINSLLYGLFGVAVYKLVFSRVKNKKINIAISIVLWTLAFLPTLLFFLFFSEYSFSWDYNHPVNYPEIRFRSILFSKN